MEIKTEAKQTPVQPRKYPWFGIFYGVDEVSGMVDGTNHYIVMFLGENLGMVVHTSGYFTDIGLGIFKMTEKFYEYEFKEFHGEITIKINV